MQMRRAHIRIPIALLCEDTFVKQVTVMVEKEKLLNFEITGDFHEEWEMKEMNVPELL